MRVKRMVAALGAAVAFVGVLAGPAAAGTGASQACTDGLGYLWGGYDDIVTISYEVGYDPLNPSVQRLWLCYSTTAYGQPNALAGGAVMVEIGTDTGTAYPGAGVSLSCLPDSGVAVGPVTCYVGTNANVAPFDVQATPAGSICLVALNGACQWYLPGVTVRTNATPYLLLGINVGTWQTGWLPTPGVDLPAQCLGILTTC